LRRRRERGATLVEMVMFIVIMAVVVGGLILAFTASLRSAPQSKRMTEALGLAKERMELIRAQRQRLGFYGFTNTTYDLCPASAHPSCNTTFGYTVQSCFYTGTVAPQDACGFGSTAQCFGGNTDYKCIRVRVMGSDGQLAELDEAFGNY
jgi:type II secretory pathway pseudopilin PulG